MRQIVTLKDIDDAKLQSEGAQVFAAKKDKPAKEPDKYKDRLIKYIPAEVIAVYLAVDSGVRGIKAFNREMPDQTILWVVSGVLFIGTWFYLKRVQKVKKVQQLIISTISFAVWVFTIGGPFRGYSWYSPLYGTAFLPLYTFLISIIEAEK